MPPPVGITPPQNGAVLFSNYASDAPTVPLTVFTSGDGYYFVKLRHASSNRVPLVFFVHGGQSVTLDVPHGDYYILFAHGSHWYGTNDLFGENTVFSATPDSIPLHVSDDYTSGWAVELYHHQYDNLPLARISPDDF